MQFEFGTDGVRGAANSVLTPSLILQIGTCAAQVLGNLYGSGARILVGRDTRLSGEMLESALVAGLTSMGCNVTTLGVIPTPGVSHLVRQVSAAGGAIISASHNKFSDNGIKFVGPDGAKLSDDLERSIESLAADWQRLPRPAPDSLGRIEHSRTLTARYAEHVLKTAAGQLTGMKLVLDCANGAASALAPELYGELGASVTAIHHSPNGVNINVNCGSTHPDDMCRTVREVGASAGLAFDGDADRVILADENGELVDGDHIMAICALHLQQQGALTGNRIVATIMSNAGLDVALAQRGIQVTRTDVGDRYVAEAMRTSGSVLGGEQSGHLLFPNLTPTGDGMVSGLQALAVMRGTGKPLSQLASVMETLPQRLVTIPVRDKESWKQDLELTRAIAEITDRVGKPEWLSVRASGTENAIRVMVQDSNLELVERAMERLTSMVTERYGAQQSGC